jgi:predicted hydrocarbon binding protein
MTDLMPPVLGDLKTLGCFKAMIVGLEDALGEHTTSIALTSAGRLYGKKLANELGLQGTTLDNLLTKLQDTLGAGGAGICVIDKVVQEGLVIKVYASQTVCSMGEPSNSNRKCTFTLGTAWGILESALGQRFKGIHTESLLRGSTHDVFEFIPF